jgi:hypothetical protein
MTRILVVGDRSGVGAELPHNLTHGELQEIFKLQQGYTSRHEIGSYSHVICLDKPETLVPSIVAIVRNSRETIDVLDIADHGRPGAMRLGKSILFEFHDTLVTGIEIIKALSPLISIGGSIRLLGCNTALDDRGRGLLTRLAAVASFTFKVYGTIDRVRPVNFRDPGFLGSNNVLFSSEAAVDHFAPSAGERETNLVNAYGAGNT